MEAIRELLKVRDRLTSQLRAIQSEVDAVEKAVKVLEREHPEAAIRTKELSNLGLSDAIRHLVQDKLVTTIKVRDLLIQGGFSYPQGKGKLLDVVWSTMRRLGRNPGYETGKVDGKFALRRRLPRDGSVLTATETVKALQ
ncbi:MAG TPA: hypothetical protein VMF10_01125 [Candidatus Aquilonibacter sp.]|nr:hypothetical protein [Candidatus Aquilonibacter sp.]